jgi:hypothetical protein
MPYKRFSPPRDTFLVIRFRWLLPLQGLFQQPRDFATVIQLFLKHNILGGFDTSSLHRSRRFWFQWAHLEISEDSALIRRPPVKRPFNASREFGMFVVQVVFAQF